MKKIITTKEFWIGTSFGIGFIFTLVMFVGLILKLAGVDF